MMLYSRMNEIGVENNSAPNRNQAAHRKQHFVGVQYVHSAW